MDRSSAPMANSADFITVRPSSASSRTELPNGVMKGTLASAPRSSLLQFATAIAVPETRLAAAEALGREFGGDRLLMFLRDEEVDAMLAAPGFPQSLPNGRLWTAFLEEVVAHGELAGQLPAATPDELVPVFALAFGRDIAFVVVGATRPLGDVEWFQTMLPMFATVFRAER